MGIPAASVDESPRYRILRALLDGPKSVAELVEATGLTNRQVLDNVRAAVGEKLAGRDLDEGTVIYSVTARGRARLAEKLPAAVSPEPQPQPQPQPQPPAPISPLGDMIKGVSPPVVDAPTDAGIESWIEDPTEPLNDTVLVRLLRIHEDAILARDRYVLTMIDPTLDALTAMVDAAERALGAYAKRAPHGGVA
jgi:hypothetical protein